MRILLSAYACEPGLGSEPGVGWNWALEIAKRGHTLWIITRPMHKKKIDKFLNKSENQFLKEKMNFIYYDLPFWKRKRGAKGTQVHYALWQLGIYKLAKYYIKKYDIELIHHITFVSARFPSLLSLLGKTFIFGPIAGGESPPRQLKVSYPFWGKVKDLIRMISNISIKYNPLMLITFNKADKIFVTSTQTKNLIPEKYHNKVKCSIAIGIENECITDYRMNKQPNSDFRILFVGNLLYWKGVHLALRAFKYFKDNCPNARFTIIGNGPEEKWLKSLALELGISESVEWIKKMDRDLLLKLYSNYDLFLFPSLQDSGGMVVLEALSKGLPVICLDIGGPGLIVDSMCGQKIEVHKKSEKQVVLELGNAILNFYNNDKLRIEASQAAILKAKNFTWESIVEKVYSDIEKLK